MRRIESPALCCSRWVFRAVVDSSLKVHHYFGGVRGAVGYVRVMGDGDDGNVIASPGGVSFGF